MFQEFLSKSPLTFWPLLAFGVFLTTFLVVVGALVWGALKNRTFDHVAGLPLDDDQDGKAGMTNE